MPIIPPRIVDPSRRIILPEEVVQALKVKPGDFVGFIIEGSKVTLAKATWKIGE